jgi:ribosomal protein S15P/S13E
MAPDDLTPDAFARLSALEQSQELLRRAQFLDTSSRVRHAAALDRHQADLARHTQTMADLAALQTRLADRQDHQAARQQDHAARMARLEDIAGRIQRTLDAVLAMLRDRNGH